MRVVFLASTLATLVLAQTDETVTSYAARHSRTLDKRSTAEIVPYASGFVFDRCQETSGFTAILSDSFVHVEDCLSLCSANSFESCVIYTDWCFGVTSEDVDGWTPYSSDNPLCHVPCPSDSSEACGGYDNEEDYDTAILVYTLGAAPVAVDPITSLGCFRDGVDGKRTLLARLGKQAHWTQEDCAAAAADEGLVYFGVEYGGECWGSNTAPDASLSIDEDQCNMTCNDAPEEICGGNWALSVFANSAVTPTPAPPAPAAPIKAVSSAFTYTACYTDSTSARTLPNFIQRPAENAQWTADSCLDAVEAAGYTYAGVIYGGEWGANDIAETASIQDAEKCLWTCNDDKTQYCGGEAGLDVYTKVDLEQRARMHRRARRAHRP